MAGYIGSKTSVVSSGVERKKTYSITGSTTSLTGLNYTVGKVHVYQNGVRLLDGTDYTATNGTSITLTVAAQSGDNVVVVSQASFQLSESYTSTESDARYVQPTHTGNLNITGTVTADGLTVNPTTSAEISGAVSGGYMLKLDNTHASSGNGLRIETPSTASNEYSLVVKSNNGSNNNLVVSNNGDISFYEDTGTTAKFFWDASAERLGIGTSSPSAPIDVVTNSNVYAAEFTQSNTSNGDGVSIVVGSTASSDYALTVRSDGGNTSGLAVKADGKVGIGTFLPSSALHIVGAGTNNQLKLERTGDGTGSYYIAATENSLAFMSDLSNERMRIDSSGKVGIGTTSPVTNLDVVTTSAGTKARIRSNTNSSPSAGLELCRGTTSTFGADAYTDFLIENINGGHLTFSNATSGTTSERMRIDSSGNLLVGKTSGGNEVQGTVLYNNGQIYASASGHQVMLLTRKTNNGEIILFYRDGTNVGNIYVTGSSTSYNTSSDYRLKENVVDLTGASARVNQLNPSRFNFIADADTTVDGFLAHEVATVVPEAITGTKDAMRDEEYEVTPAVLDDDGNVTTEAVMGTRSVPDYQGIDQSKLVPLLTAALQEALTEISDLKARVTALEA